MNFTYWHSLVAFLLTDSWQKNLRILELVLLLMLSSRCSHCWLNVWWCYWLSLIYIHHLTYSTIFQVFSSSRRDSGGGIYRAGSSSLSLLPYFDMADLASSGPYIVSKHYLIFGKKLQKNNWYIRERDANVIGLTDKKVEAWPSILLFSNNTKCIKEVKAWRISLNI